MMLSTTISEAFIGEPIDLDPIVFQLWLQGHEVESVTERQQIVAQSQWSLDELPETETGRLQKERIKQFVREDTEHQYRVLNMLRRYLKKPHRMLLGQCPYQLSPWQQAALIDGYYRFNADLVRNVLGHNLTDTYSRKEYESLASRANISPDDCARQMCNLKRVYQSQEVPELMSDFPPPQSGEDIAVYFYRRYFGLSPDLAARYSRILLTHWGLPITHIVPPERPAVFHISSSSMSVWPPSLTPPATPHLMPVPMHLRQQSGGSSPSLPSLEVKPVKSLPGFDASLLDTAFLVDLKELKAFERDKKGMEEYIAAVASSLDVAVPAKPDAGRSRTTTSFLKTSRSRAMSPSVQSTSEVAPPTPGATQLIRTQSKKFTGAASSVSPADAAAAPSSFTFATPSVTPIQLPPTAAATPAQPLTPRLMKPRSASDKLSLGDSTGSLVKPKTPSVPSKLVSPPAAGPSISPSILRREAVKSSNTNRLKARYTRDLIKSLANIAVGLEKGKNLRNFFADLAETAVRPLTKLGLTGPDVEHLFEILQEVLPQRMQQREDLCALWKRFLSAVAPIFLVLYCRAADPGAAALARYPQEETENQPSLEVTANDVAQEAGEEVEEVDSSV